MTEDSAETTYRGLVGAYRYAFRRSGSWVFRSYVCVSAISGLYFGILLGLALITWIANPVGFGDRAFLAVLGLFVLIPLFTPVLIVARRYRRGSSSGSADRLLAVAGYGFLLSIGLALFISDPMSHDVSGPLAIIDALPRIYGLLPPIIGVGGIVLVIRYSRSNG